METVFRYTTPVPQPAGFFCEGAARSLWFSVVAVYEEPLDDIPYAWAWTTRARVDSVGVAGKDGPAPTDALPTRQSLPNLPDQPVDMCFTLCMLPDAPEPTAEWSTETLSGDTSVGKTRRGISALTSGENWFTSGTIVTMTLDGIP